MSGIGFLLRPCISMQITNFNQFQFCELVSFQLHGVFAYEKMYSHLNDNKSNT